MLHRRVLALARVGRTRRFLHLHRNAAPALATAWTDGDSKHAPGLITGIACALGALCSASCVGAEEEEALLSRASLARLLRGELTKVRSTALGEPGWSSPVATGLARVSVRTPVVSARAADAARRAMATPPPTPVDVVLSFPGASAAEMQALLAASGLDTPKLPGGAVAIEGRFGSQWQTLAPGAPWPADVVEVRVQQTPAQADAPPTICTLDVLAGTLTLHVPSSGIPRAVAECVPGALAAAWVMRLPPSAAPALRHAAAPLPPSGVGLQQDYPLGSPSPSVQRALAAYPPSFQRWLEGAAGDLLTEWSYWRAVAADVDMRVFDTSASRKRGLEEGPTAAIVEEGGPLPPIQHTAGQAAWAAKRQARLDWLGQRFLAWLFEHWASAGAGAQVALPPAAVPGHLTPWTASSGFSPLPPHLQGVAAEFVGHFLGRPGARFEADLVRSALGALVGDGSLAQPTPPAGGPTNLNALLSALQSQAAAGKEHGRSEGGGDGPPAVVHGEDVPPELADLPCEVYTQDSHVAEGVGWGDLAGYPAVRQAVQENILLPRQHPDVFARVAAAARGVDGEQPKAAHQSGVYLFAGPPGTGKTTTARVIAAEVDVPLVCLSFESIASALYGKSQQALDKVLRTLSSLPQGAVLFVDEADTFFPHRGRARGHTSDEYDARHLSIFLKWLEGIDAAAAARVTVVLATNREEALDPALLSRVALTLQFELPDATARRAIWEKYAAALPPAAVDQLVTATDGFSARDILRASQLAERRHATAVIQARGSGGASTSEPGPPPLEVYLECAQDKEGGVATAGGDGARRRGALPRSGQYGNKL